VNESQCTFQLMNACTYEDANTELIVCAFDEAHLGAGIANISIKIADCQVDLCSLTCRLGSHDVHSPVRLRSTSQQEQSVI
jgi:hypothetical protein